MGTMLGVWFLASEYSTGPVHGGRIDSLGLDENDAPVVVEHGRGTDAGVINQGLFYSARLAAGRAAALSVHPCVGSEGGPVLLRSGRCRGCGPCRGGFLP
ncbi:transporter [Streptomyces chrestomyceticus JCM 4735]|uniref:Transporter n=1 Tax=Streptomyces chrestomyceticus JCM 4735 TaxID=1306181 RepID=A0A7U9KP69_9ACTN|nr:transporter [Streptomyces chrestomyceticus JCM 4735]